MARVFNGFVFRARAETIPWMQIARQHQVAVERRSAGRLKHLATFDFDRLEGRGDDVRLTWVCSREIGVPLTPFTVWQRAPYDPKEFSDLDVRAFDAGDPALLAWGVHGELAILQVTCSPSNPTKPVMLTMFRNGGDGPHIVAAAAVNPAGQNQVTLTARSPGATYALLHNGHSLTVTRGVTMADVVDDPNWTELEIVGLPSDDPIADYDLTSQGLTSNLTSPVDAALSRLERGSPPFGWWPVTEGWRDAPPWKAPDPHLLLDEIGAELLPQLRRIYRNALPEWGQWDEKSSQNVAGPAQAGRPASTLPTTAETRPLGTLLLSATSDPFLNLACGFGTAYRSGGADDGDPARIGPSELLVTAPYRDLPRRFGGIGAVELAAYAPWGQRHTVVADPTGLTARRDGLVEPAAPDLAWRESIRLQWDRVLGEVAMPSITETAFAVYDLAGTGPAESLLPERDAGGPRPLVLTPDGPEGAADYHRTAAVHADAEIPLDSGGRNVGYAVAVSDVFGIWSRWQDVAYQGNEPGPAAPSLIDVKLDTQAPPGAGTACPSELSFEFSVDWSRRTPIAVDAAVLCFPMAAADTSPPADLSAGVVTPAGCFRRDYTVTFNGDVPDAGAAAIVALNREGTATAVPPGSVTQGDEGRRYRLTADVPTLDFGGTNRWGARVWVRARLAAGASPSAWAPLSDRGAVAVARNPLPVAPMPPPPVPNVPLGSAPDTQGRSHARVVWSVSDAADLQAFVIWHTDESALRETLGMSAAPVAHRPGDRLQAVRAAYQAANVSTKRRAFRRLDEVSPDNRAYDAALPKGSTDIHFFVVTTLTKSGVETPWPASELALQPVIGPRLRRPGQPTLRNEFDAAGVLTLKVDAPSPLPVAAFHLYRTRSSEAARAAESMGPPFAVVAADPVDPINVDVVVGQQVYTATWSGSFPAHWDPWGVRAVAVPQLVDGVLGVRGVPSPASDVISVVSTPPGPPDLAPLTSDVFGATHNGVVVFTSTSAPDWASPAGAHRLTATVDLDPVTNPNTTVLELPPAGLDQLPVSDVSDPTAAPDVSAGPAAGRGSRTTGRTPLAVWFERPDPAEPAEATVRIIDPAGRSTEHTIIVPGWTPPVPQPLVEILGTTVVVGRGVSVAIRTDADGDWTLRITATRRPGLIFGPRPQGVSGSWRISDIPAFTFGLNPAGRITVVRLRRDNPFDPGANLAASIPLAAPMRIEVSVISPTGEHARDIAEVGR